jgi:hypothetical protein
MLKSLQADPAYSQAVGYGATAESGQPNVLRNPRPGAAGAAQPPMVQVTGVANPLLPKSPSEFNWSAGIRFSPAMPGPKYGSGGKSCNLGAMFTGGARLVPGIGLSEMASLGVEFLGEPSRMVLFIELPPGQASYMVAISLAEATGKPISGIVSAIKAYACDGSGGDDLIKLVPLSDGSGVVGVCNVVPMQDPNGVLSFEARKYWGMNSVSAYLDITLGNWVSSTFTIWHPHYLVFGGITVSRL